MVLLSDFICLISFYLENLVFMLESFIGSVNRTKTVHPPGQTNLADRRTVPLSHSVKSLPATTRQEGCNSKNIYMFAATERDTNPRFCIARIMQILILFQCSFQKLPGTFLGGIVEYLLGAAFLCYNSLIHKYHTIRYFPGETHLMSYNQHGKP